MTCETVAKTRVDAKRSFDNEAIQFDWHDYVAKVWKAGSFFGLGQCIRFKRNDPRSPGLQMRCTQAGATGGKQPFWPRVAGETTLDGGVEWTAEALTDDSIDTIASSEFPAVDGLTLSQETSNDLVYTIWAAGGTSGEDYDVKHRIVLTGAAAQAKEMVAVLPVRD